MGTTSPAGDRQTQTGNSRGGRQHRKDPDHPGEAPAGRRVVDVFTEALHQHDPHLGISPTLVDHGADGRPDGAGDGNVGLTQGLALTYRTGEVTGQFTHPVGVRARRPVSDLRHHEAPQRHSKNQ